MKELCVKCSYNGCNNQSKSRSPELSCLKCNDTKLCAFGQDVSLATKCSRNVQIGEEESCFIYSFPGKTFYFLQVFLS